MIQFFLDVNVYPILYFLLYKCVHVLLKGFFLIFNIKNEWFVFIFLEEKLVNFFVDVECVKCIFDCIRVQIFKKFVLIVRFLVLLKINIDILENLVHTIDGHLLLISLNDLHELIQVLLFIILKLNQMSLVLSLDPLHESKPTHNYRSPGEWSRKFRS